MEHEYTLKRAEIWRNDDVVALAVGDEAEAAFMIHAANCHDELLAVCERFLLAQDDRNSATERVVWMGQAVTAARAAIAKAKKGA